MVQKNIKIGAKKRNILHKKINKKWCINSAENIDYCAEKYKTCDAEKYEILCRKISNCERKNLKYSAKKLEKNMIYGAENV